MIFKEESNYSNIKATFTVGELSEYIKNTLERTTHLRNLEVIGEISNHFQSSSGHNYFSLKDEKAVIRCVMFKESSGIEYLENGQLINAQGYISFYKTRGDLQIYVNKVEPEGIGSLQKNFELLKTKLESEGLFDISRKRSLPKYPKFIGIATSKKGSVLQDILNIIKRRYPLIKIKIADTKVQGKDSSSSIVKSIKALESQKNIELIILARGGGSLEDLWPFNEEIVAKSIFACKVPVVSAIGHETDVTISDLVSDLRAPTPSAAAEIITPDIVELRNSISQKLNEFYINIDFLISKKTSNLEITFDPLLYKKPDILSFENRINQYSNSIKTSFLKNYEKFHLTINSLENSLRTLDPKNVLSRGYSIISKKNNNKVITKTNQLKVGDLLSITIKNGEIEARTTNLKNKIRRIDDE
ncbi:MAG: exodeoxyribonuclease VII large subunit [Dehalococcoidia bacterium]|nr:exodeoxyribonuclease VII large subunit [Dehalococcoidia bacterium]